MTSADYQHGRAAGLREAAEIVRRLEDRVLARLARSAPRRTTEARKVRCTAHRVAARRIDTALRKTERACRLRGEKITTKLKELGL